MNTEAYKKDPLRFALNLAYAQAMTGKGKERHGDEKPFVEQISMSITKAIGLAYPLGQAWKKADEAQRMPKEAAIRELLGAINYIAIAIISLIDGGKES